MRKLSALVGSLALAAGLIGLSASAATAHAVLERTFPVDGSVVDSTPAEVRLEFSEAVNAPPGAIRVYDASGNRIDSGVVSSDGPETVLTAMGDSQSHGTHIVTWRVVSADGHPIKGAFVFSVGEAEGIDASVVADLLGAAGDRPYAIAAGIARWLTYLGALTAIGALAFTTFVGGQATDQVRRLVRVTATVGAVASLAQIPLFAAESTGLGFSALSSGAVWADALSSSVGIAAISRAAGLAVLAVAFPRRVAWVGATLVLFAELVTGHTRTTEPTWLVMASAAVHVMAAAAWLGGLAALILTMRQQKRQDDPEGAAASLAAFSRLATVSILALGLAGIALSWTQVRSPDALLTTTYGRTLLVKLAIVAAVLAVGIYNNRVLVPSITGDKPGSEPDREGAWRRLGRTVRWEVLGIVLAVGVTAFLVNLQPAAEAAGVTGPYSTFVDFGDGELNVVIDPNRAGLNQMHAYILTAEGLLADDTSQVTFEITMPSEEIGPFIRTPIQAGPGHYIHTGHEMALPGEWELLVRMRVSDFEEITAVVRVIVR